MNPRAGYKPLTNSNDPCPDVAALAERELSAFFDAITQLFGSKQAELGAEDWLRELIEIDGLPASTREWRLITAKVAARLVSRLASPLASPLTASSLSAEPQIA